LTRAAAIFWGWAASIVLVWFLVALALEQPFWTRQHSVDLTAFGAFKGQTLTFGDSWKLVVSQWLHVKFAHMLFNAAIIGFVGAALTQRLMWPLVLALGIIGGACGQLASALGQPDAYVSGASQAYLALCGAGLLVLGWKRLGWWAAAIGVLVSIGLDVVVSGHSGIKPGHFVGFVVGLIAGAVLLVLDKRRSGWAILRRN